MTSHELILSAGTTDTDLSTHFEVVDDVINEPQQNFALIVIVNMKGLPNTTVCFTREENGPCLGNCGMTLISIIDDDREYCNNYHFHIIIPVL